jgi:hypothetical protein
MPQARDKPGQEEGEEGTPNTQKDGSFPVFLTRLSSFAISRPETRKCPKTAATHILPPLPGEGRGGARSRQEPVKMRHDTSQVSCFQYLSFLRVLRAFFVFFV